MKFGRLILANLLRKKARLVLTIGSFAVGSVSVCAAGSGERCVQPRSGRGECESPRHHQSHLHHQHHSVVPTGMKILRIPGVKYITHDNWFGGRISGSQELFSRNS
jgi:hypothetical protein